MKNILLILNLIVSVSIFGQTSDLNSTKIDTNYTWRNSSIVERDSFYLDLPIVNNSDYKTHFRISLTGQTVDFFSNDNVNFQGILTNEITEYKTVKAEWGEGSESYQIISQKLQIDSDLCSTVAMRILKTGQGSLPTDSLISTWNKWYLHCGSIEFQFNTNGDYHAQTYHCPWSQPDTAKFKNIIISNFELLNEKLELEKYYDEFEDLLPKGKTYSRDGYRMIYIFTDEQSEAWEKDKPRRDYLKSIKDTIDNYLRTELSEQDKILDNINCFEDYRLTFGENGKLEKVKVSDYNKPKLSDGLDFYFEDRQEIRKCRKLIKQIFKEIDLSSFNLKYKFYRTLSFGLEGEIQLRDDTIY